MSEYPQDITSTLPDGQQLGSHGHEPPGVIAPSEPAGPLPVVGSGGVVGPLSREEVLTLKIAEHVLCRAQLALAVASLLRGARKAGKSGVQKLVLAADLEELERRMQQADSIKWPNNASQQRAD